MDYPWAMRVLLVLFLISTAAQAEIVYNSFRDNGDGSVTFAYPKALVAGEMFSIAPGSAESVCSSLGYAYSLSAEYRSAMWGRYNCVRVHQVGYDQPAQFSDLMKSVTCTNHYDLVLMKSMRHENFDWDEVFGRN